MGKRSPLQILKKAHRFNEVLNAIKCTDQWLGLALMYTGLKTPQFPFTFKTRSGQSLEINTFHDLITIWVIFCRKEYKIPQGTKVVIDAGANIGSFSIFACSENVEEVFALEPFPDTFSQLEKNIKSNGLEEKVKLNPIALADQSGTRNMDLNDGPSQSRGLLADDNDQGLSVKTMTLKDFITQTGHAEIDLLKIDIEGGEHEVFHSSTPETLQKIKSIAMEYHPNASKKDLFNKITSANFKLTFDFPISDESGVAYFKRQ